MFDGYFSGDRNSNMRIREYKNGQKVGEHDVFITKQYEYDDKTITLQSDCDSVVIFLTAKSAEEIMYYDNFRVQVLETFETGITFDSLVKEGAIAGSTGSAGNANGKWADNSTHVFNMSRTYFDGSYVMMGSTNKAYPAVHLDYDNELPVGTKLTFDVYVGTSGAAGTFKAGATGYANNVASNDTRVVYNISNNGSAYFATGEWHTITVTFTKAHTHMRLMVEPWGDLSGTAVNIYYDNFYIQVPETFETGITFDGLVKEGAVVGSTGSAGNANGKWADNSTHVFNMSRTYFDGSYVMMGSTNKAYPAIHFDYDNELPVDTKLTFDVYVGTSGAAGTFKAAAYGYADNVASNDTRVIYNLSKNGSAYFATGEWHTITVTFAKAHTHMRFIVEPWGDLSGTTVNIYYDNFRIQVPRGTAVTKGQTVYFGALTKENALKTELYSANQTLLGNVAEEELTLVDSMSDTYGIYSYTVNSNEVKYIYTPLNARSAYYATIVKEDNIASKEDIMKEFATAMGIATPSESAVDVLTGKTALFLGDSVVQGVLDKNCIYSEKGYAGRIGYYYNLGAVQNNAQSGACLGYNEALIEERANERYYICNQLAEEIEKGSEYDYIIMHGLYNDKPRNAIGTPMGPDNFDVDQVDITTMAGALEMLFYTAQTEFATAKLGFIVMFDAKEGKDISDYAAMAMQICEAWCVPYLDLLTGSSKGVLADGTVIDLPDNLHPSSAGYDSYYAKIGDWMATIE